jgi:YggT family protein
MAWLLLLYTLKIFQLLILVRVILSWVAGPFSRSPWVEMVRRATDPIVLPIRSLMPNTGPFDFSAMVALILLSLLQSFVAGMAAAAM